MVVFDHIVTFAYQFTSNFLSRLFIALQYVLLHTSNCHGTCNYLILGLRNEGWFDPWLFLQAFKKKIVSMGVDFVNAEVTGISVKDGKVQSIKVHDNLHAFKSSFIRVHF